ncbi:arginine permease [Trypanosoma cruzi]|uniref:Arginine permease n=1 Tax=Trypanosoma cruzi TaxID=5693 RepID=A0A2V2UST5_TRYCR|nr:arginine permease [Trypanosoma cruzi]
MFSLSLPKEINSLRYASAVGVICIYYFIACIVVHSVQHGFRGGKLRDDVAMFKSGNGAIEGLSIFMFSYLCHMNCFSIFGEMRKPSARRMTLHTACSMSLCCIAYIVAGFFGYADFGDEVTDTVLVFYDVRRDVLMAIAYAGIVLKLCVGFALCMQPARDCCYYIIGWDVATIPAWRNWPFLWSYGSLRTAARALYSRAEHRLWAAGQFLWRHSRLLPAGAIPYVLWELESGHRGNRELCLHVPSPHGWCGCGCLWHRGQPVWCGSVMS